jgi:hypothetical protein
MEFRYMGFDQRDNARTFRFDVVVVGEPHRHCTVTADLALFLAQRIVIQEAPALCAQKLASDLAGGVEGEHELTEADLRVFVHARNLAEEQRAERRTAASRRASGTGHNSPWPATK